MRLVPIVSVTDGFLATNSVLAMAVSACSAYGWALPPRLPWLNFDHARDLTPVRSRCVVLSGPRYSSVAQDLEARFSESGLAFVQATDYRNFAHGRHAGVARLLDELSVVAFVAPEYRLLAERTISLLPSDTHLVELATDLSFPSGVLDLLVASMRLVGATGDSRDFDVARPSVPAFGRKLYHMRMGSLDQDDRSLPVERKLDAADLGARYREPVSSALGVWLQDIRRQQFRALVLDYDGTCCFTADRFDPPPDPVIDGLVGLLKHGLVLGFASGRGRSLAEAARQWIPRALWDQVTLGLYNGTVRVQLSSPLEDYRVPAEPMRRVADQLGELQTLGDTRIDARRTQVSVSCEGLTGTQLLPIVQAMFARGHALDLRIVASGHSVDITPSSESKASVVHVVGSSVRGGVLAIGDQGQPGGNDFDMLAASPWSLSVDRCSPDLSRCWNLDTAGATGPDVLHQYLEGLQPHDDGDWFVFRWKSS